MGRIKTMKDMLGREIQVNDYITYALTAGRSACLGIYQVREVFEDKIKAHKLESSYGNYENRIEPTTGLAYKFLYYDYDAASNKVFYTEKSEEDKRKTLAKTSTISMPERAFILNNFDPSLLKDL